MNVCADNFEGIQQEKRLKAVQLTAVAIIEPVGGHGGMDYYDFGLAKGLASAGTKVWLYTCDKTKIPKDIHIEVRRYFSGIFGSSPKMFRAVRFFRGLLVSLIHARYKEIRIVHFHFFNTSLMELASIVIAKAIIGRVVVTAHDVESLVQEQRGRFAKSIYFIADHVIAHNQISRNELVSLLGVSIQKIHIVPHGHYIECISEISKTKARQELEIPEAIPVMLFFGQIKDVKGLDVLLHALPDVISKHPNIMLLIAGKVWKSNFEKYRKIILENGVEKHIRLDIRYIPDCKVSTYYAASDLVVLPYLKIYQSGVLLMAMSYRRPVIVSDIPGMLEIIQDRNNGYVFRSGDSVHLAERLKYVLGRPDELTRVALAGYKTVQDYHGWRRIGLLTSDIYRSVLAEKRSHGIMLRKRN